ncbi:nucleoside-diphosphate sugar epimerase/dehydratase [Cognatishimia sp. MH4019]|uniref:polysaccharide biosynthesis protein n=1 Tax=Cognatishimia sp. MH4019 TaxID=2854030 RepID=UPI001CD1AA14|nr:nucleoside-diphosphate sugar epimerase/dehydratase [Cognatishimia sp. MH4019]
MVNLESKSVSSLRSAITEAAEIDIKGWLIQKARRRLRGLRANRRVFVLDLIVCALAISLAYVLRLGIYNDLSRFAPLQLLVPLSVLAGAVVYPVFGLYRQHVMTTSLRDAVHIAWASALMVGVVVLSWSILRSLDGVPRTAFIIQFLLAVPMHGAVRIYARRADLRFRGAPRELKAVDVLMVGTGTSCDLFLRANQRDPDPVYRPMGILDDAGETRGLFFHNVPILGSILEVEDALDRMVAEDRMPRQIILTEPTTHYDLNAVGVLHRWAEINGIGMSRLPGLCELKGMSDSATGLEPGADINLTNLLDRPQKVIDESRLRRMVTGRKVLVTGAGGSIGSELVRQIASLEPLEIILMESSEYNLYAIDMDLQQHFPDVPRTIYLSNIRDRGRVREIFGRHGPELVFHAAALKHVPMVELNPCEGTLTNVVGTRNIADAAYDYNALAFVQVSTDKAVNTTNVMGATKRVAEFYCQALDRRACREGVRTRFMTVRFGNVLGSSGSLIPLFQRQIAQGGPLTITDPRMERFFMTIREAVELTLLASANGLADNSDVGQIFVLDMGEPIRIIDLAERMIRLAGLKKGIDIDIDIVGIRPGEKLFEELFDINETPMACGMDGVQAARPTGVPLNELRTAILQLSDKANHGDANAILQLLSQLVPGYRDDLPCDQAQARKEKALKTPDVVLANQRITFKPHTGKAGQILAMVDPARK